MRKFSQHLGALRPRRHATERSTQRATSHAAKPCDRGDFGTRGGLIHEVEVFPFVTQPLGLGDGWTPGSGR